MGTQNADTARCPTFFRESSCHQLGAETAVEAQRVGKDDNLGCGTQAKALEATLVAKGIKHVVIRGLIGRPALEVGRLAARAL